MNLHSTSIASVDAAIGEMWDIQCNYTYFDEKLICLAIRVIVSWFILTEFNIDICPSWQVLPCVTNAQLYNSLQQFPANCQQKINSIDL